LLGQFLAETAVRQGVQHLKEKIVDVGIGETGNIESLRTESGEHIEGDFFVGCSGFASILMQKALKVPFRSYKESLFNDSVVVMASPVTEPVPVETKATAMGAGWC
jgi:flavin-dependent dehydrogenase